MSHDTTFGRVAVKQNFATEAEIKSCYQIRQKLEALGIEPKPIEEIMLEKGIISTQERRKILHILKDDFDSGDDGPPPPSIKIDGYELLEQIGTGGMGTVFRARQLSMDRIVALKVLPIRLSQDREFVAKFKQEAKTLARLNHKNIVAGIHIGLSNGYHYFAMEYVDGQALNQLLKEKTKLSEKMVIDIALQMTQALSYIHKQDLVHCDIKPHNIMLTQNGTAKLCDLGLTRKMGSKAEKEDQQAVGTPHYISPEQAKGIEEVDGRSDIYSLGATMYHLLVGEPPFSGSSPMVVMTKHLTDPIVPPIKRNPKVSVALNSVVMKMMAKRKADRYQSAEELSTDLEQIRDGKALKSSARSKGGTTGLQARRLSRPESPGRRGLYDKKGQTRGNRAQSKSGGLSGHKSRTINYQLKQEKASLLIFVGLILALIGGGVYLSVSSSGAGKYRNVNREDNERAWQLLDEAASFKNSNPDDREGVMFRYRKVMENYPGTRAARYAKKMILDLE